MKCVEITMDYGADSAELKRRVEEALKVEGLIFDNVDILDEQGEVVA